MTQFSAASQIERETYGMTAPLYLKQAYNNRLQLVDTRLGSVNDATNWDRGRLSLVYGTTTFNLANTRDTANTELTIGDLQGTNPDNNGNIKRMYSFLPNGMIPQRDDYSYDPLNRLTAMTECQRQTAGGAMVTNVANQAYGYDRYGNNTITGLNGSNLAFSAVNNRITTANYGYDSVGNLTSENNQARTYDAENRMVSAASSGFYTYDGEGRRVKRTAGTTTCYVYGINGELLAEYLSTAMATNTPSKQYGYKGGKLLVTAEGATLRWLVTDHLGSTRMELDGAGGVASRHDYLPFGGELYAGLRQNASSIGMYGYEPPVSSMRQRFTGYERDNETGLDFAQTRYFSNSQGRFTSYDPVFVTAKRLADPQQLNLYSYARNTPLKFIDPNGMDLVLTARNEQEARKRFRIYQLGFTEEDRESVQLVVGNGRNGFKKGQFGVTVDAKHQSTSGNFLNAQKAANDHTAVGKISVVKQGGTYQLKESYLENGKDGFKTTTNKLGPRSQEFDGYTVFEYRGKRETGIIYASGVSEMIIHGDQSDADVSAAMHHETRHLVLGDFGRSALKAKHSESGQPKNTVDIETDKADKEAIQNAKKP